MDDADGDPMSMSISSIWINNGGTPEQFSLKPDGSACAGFTAGFARGLQQALVRDELPDDLSHGKVVGDKSRAKKKFARNCSWVVAPKAIHLGGGYFIYAADATTPRLREPTGITSFDLDEGPPENPDWLKIVEAWLADATNDDAVLRGALNVAVWRWTVHSSRDPLAP